MALPPALDPAICARRAESEEAIANLHHDGVGTPVHVGRREAKQAEAGADEAILPAVVVDQSFTMISAVVFDDQALKVINQVWSP